MRLLSIRNLILTVIALLLFPVFLNLEANAASLSLSPATSTLVTGNSYDMYIYVNTEGADIISADVTINYDPSKVTIVSITPGTIFSQSNRQTNVGGVIVISRGIPTDGTAYNGSQGLYATIRFTALTSGTANFTIPYNTGTTSPSILATIGSNLLTSVQNATYSIQEAAGNPTPTPTSLPDTGLFDDLGIVSTIIAIAAIGIGGNEIYQLKRKVNKIYNTEAVTAQ